MKYLVKLYKKYKAQQRISELLGMCSLLRETDIDYAIKKHAMLEVSTLEYKYCLGTAKYAYDPSEYLEYSKNFKNVL
jgi:hypothetical protein